MSSNTQYGPLDVPGATPAAWKQGKKPAVRSNARVARRIPSDPAANAQIDPAKSAAARMDPVDPRHSVDNPPVKVQGELIDPVPPVEVPESTLARYQRVLAALSAITPRSPAPSSKVLLLQQRVAWAGTLTERISSFERKLESGPMTAAMLLELRAILKDCWESLRGAGIGALTELFEVMAAGN